MEALELTCATIEDIYDLPEGQRAELINGQLYMMAPPRRRHQRILSYLHTEISMYIRRKKGDCEVYPAPFAVFPYADDKTYVEPDISVICDKSKLDDRGCNGAPDWIIEIVSPGNAMHDYMRKFNLYGNAGVREYWIADYEKNRITVYNFECENMAEYAFSDKVKTGIYDDLEIDFSPLKEEIQ